MKRRSIESYLTEHETNCLKLSIEKLAYVRRLVQQEQKYIRKLKASGYNRRLHEEKRNDQENKTLCTPVGPQNAPRLAPYLSDRGVPAAHPVSAQGLRPVTHHRGGLAVQSGLKVEAAAIRIAEALVRHLRRAIRRQKARAAQ